MVELLATPFFELILLKSLTLYRPANISHNCPKEARHTSDPLSSKARATRSTETIKAAVRKSTEYFFDTL